MPPKKPPTTGSNSKAPSVSRTLIHFARPLFALLEERGEVPDQEVLEGLFQITTTIWNAVTADKWNKTTEHVDAARKMIDDLPPHIVVAALHMLVDRFQHFDGAPWGVDNVSVRIEGGNLIVRAEARDEV